MSDMMPGDDGVSDQISHVNDPDTAVMAIMVTAHGNDDRLLTVMIHIQPHQLANLEDEMNALVADLEEHHLGPATWTVVE